MDPSPDRRSPQPDRPATRYRLLFPLLAFLMAAVAVRALGSGDLAGFRSWWRGKTGGQQPPAAAVVSTNAPAAPAAGDAEPVQKELKPEPIHPLVARNVARRLPAMHLTRMPLNDGIAARALALYMDKLDYDRTVFLASDIEEFRNESDKLDDAIKNGDLSFAFRAFETYKARLRNRSAFVNDLLGKRFDFDLPETYSWKRKEAPWPATLEQWDDLWRLKI